MLEELASKVLSRLSAHDEPPTTLTAADSGALGGADGAAAPTEAATTGAVHVDVTQLRPLDAQEGGGEGVVSSAAMEAAVRAASASLTNVTAASASASIDATGGVGGVFADGQLLSLPLGESGGSARAGGADLASYPAGPSTQLGTRGTLSSGSFDHVSFDQRALLEGGGCAPGTPGTSIVMSIGTDDAARASMMRDSRSIASSVHASGGAGDERPGGGASIVDEIADEISDEIGGVSSAIDEIGVSSDPIDEEDDVRLGAARCAISTHLSASPHISPHVLTSPASMTFALTCDACALGERSSAASSVVDDAIAISDNISGGGGGEMGSSSIVESELMGGSGDGSRGAHSVSIADDVVADESTNPYEDDDFESAIPSVEEVGSGMVGSGMFGGGSDDGIATDVDEVASEVGSNSRCAVRPHLPSPCCVPPPLSDLWRGGGRLE